MGLVLYDDATARAFEPFALTRPAGELRAGGELIRRRWAALTGLAPEAFIGAPHLASFEEFDAPRAATGELPPGTVVALTRCAPALPRPAQRASLPATTGRWRCDGRVAAVRLARAMPVAEFAEGRITLDDLAFAGAEADVDGWWLDAVWDLIRHLNPMLAADAVALASCAARAPGGVTVLGDQPLLVEPDAVLEPQVVVDTSAGPVLVRRGARVQAFTRLNGPCVIGEGALVTGGKVGSCAIGERVKVNGEIAVSILVGHANKVHDGYVGHSVIGRWANLGAGTTTSNMKNSYGPVALWTPAGVRDSGMQFLGSLIGDHAKTGIGTRLTTGAVVGAGANLFGTAMPPKVVPPFAWGDAPPWDWFELPKFLEVAERVMARREVALSADQRAQLGAAHAKSVLDRARWSA